MFRLLVARLVLFFILLVTYIPLVFSAFFIKKKHRAYFWRWCSVIVLRITFFSARVSVRTSNNDFQDGPCIYASNHPSEMDGFVLQMLLGPKVIPIIAPHQQFPFLVALWLKRMGAIDVVRDDIDNALYEGSNTKHQALHKAVQALKQGHSILIFPEGHTEMIEALYRFHTGAVRISFASHKPIQSIILKDAHRVFLNTIKATTRVITVEFGKSFVPESVYDEKVLFTEDEIVREKIRSITKELEREVLNRLPIRDISDQRFEANDVAVFVDIDLTIYRSLSQIDFLISLTRQGLIPIHHFAYVVSLFVFEKIHIISHQRLMEEAMSLISGWCVDAIDRLIKRFFRELAIPKIEYGLFALLEDHLAKRHHLVFVTETMHPIAQAFVSFFHAEGAIDTSLKKRGLTYTGEISLLCRDKAKANAVAEFIQEHTIDAKKSYAYADGYSDIPFMSLVGHKMAVNPDRKLRMYAHLHHIPILKKHN